MDSQIQAGGSDCGLFAIANATALMVKKDPGKFFYDQKKMRRHLFECLGKRKITLFPVKRERHALTKISAICRLPEGMFPCEEWGECTKCDRT